MRGEFKNFQTEDELEHGQVLEVLFNGEDFLVHCARLSEYQMDLILPMSSVDICLNKDLSVA